jgi:hypothetical protein
VRYTIVSPLDTSHVHHLYSPKKPNNIYTFHCHVTFFLVFVIPFQIRFVDFVSMVESCYSFRLFMVVV